MRRASLTMAVSAAAGSPSFVGDPSCASTIAAYRTAYPQDPQGVDLANWDAFERANPRTFVGMYQFWVRKPPQLPR